MNELVVYATAVYTGGSIYCYFGRLSDGNFLLMADGFEAIRILREDPEKYPDDYAFQEWQDERLVRDINDDAPEFVLLWNSAIDWILAHRPEGNYSIMELENRRKARGSD